MITACRKDLQPHDSGDRHSLGVKVECRMLISLFCSGGNDLGSGAVALVFALFKRFGMKRTTETPH